MAKDGYSNEVHVEPLLATPTVKWGPANTFLPTLHYYSLIYEQTIWWELYLVNQSPNTVNKNWSPNTVNKIGGFKSGSVRTA